MQNGTECSKQMQKQNLKLNEKIEYVIRKYSNMIFRIAYNNLGNIHDAQDILQEVALSVVTNNAPLDDDNHLRYWLCRVTVNKCKNFSKKAASGFCEPLDENIPMDTSSDYGITDELMRLPADYRNVLYLYYYEEMTIDQIAEVLNKNPNTIGSQLRRGRKKLEKLLIEGGYVYD